MKKPEQLYKERMQMFKDAINFKKPSRVPIISSSFSSKVYEAGYKLSEALFDWDIYKDCMIKYQEKYQPDAYLNNGFRNPLRIPRAMGGKDYVIDDDTNSLNMSDKAYTQPEDYPLIKEDLMKYVFEVLIPTKYKGVTKEKLLEGMKESANLLNYLGDIDGTMKDEYGVCPLLGHQTFMPFEFVANGMRGLVGASIDLRRRKGELKEVLEVINNHYDPIASMSRQPDGTSEHFIVDNAIIMMAYTLLSPKQFEEIYWPTLKEVIQYNADHGKKVYVFAQGNCDRFYEYFQEFPKGTVAMQFEMADIFETRKKLDNICLIGGFPYDLLINGTPNECRDYAKRLVEELGGQGGYIFSTSKLLSFKVDVNEENLKAAHETVINYNL